jgi:NAD(P)-dependent dehydrogenase (short-subunit alcohol dehydrogenase family)
MERGGSIVLIGSIASFISSAGYTSYATSKGAVLQLGRGMALDLAPRGVRVNVVCPGACDTPMLDRTVEGPSAAAAREAIAAGVPLGRVGTAEEIARAALFFASADASFCTGASLVADGGTTVL